MQLLYGKLWSDEDAKYAKELELDMSLTAPDLERLWRTNRPSVRGGQGQPDLPSLGVEQEPEKPTAEVEQAGKIEQDAWPNSFAEWLVQSGLTMREAAEKLGASVGSIHRWKRDGAPADIAKLLHLGTTGKGG